MFRTLKYIVYYYSPLYQFYPKFLLIFTLSHKRLRWSRFSVLAKFAGSHPAEAVGFLGRKKIPQHAFLRRGSKAAGIMS